MLRRQLVIAVSTGLIFLGATGCSFDIEPGSQLAGQKCSTDEDCAEGLVCSERICRHSGGTSPSGIEPDGGVPDGDAPEVGPGPVDAPLFEVGHECVSGERRCDSEDTFQVCQTASDGSRVWSNSRLCAADEVCENGDCVAMCDDDEVFNPVSGECESGSEPCCPGGCAGDEICHDCSCVEFNSQTCQYQDQPCEAVGQAGQDYFCVDFDGLIEPRCMGRCDPGASDPHATCAGPNTVCTYEDETDPEGLCFTSCAIDEPCADDGMRCVYVDGTFDDGICYPSTGTGDVGDACDGQDPFSCAGQALCIEGMCRQSCRPFGQSETDCDDGYCLPFSDTLGLCTGDASDGQGGCTAEGGTCGEDAVGCFPSEEPDTAFQCYEFCRLQDEADDCSDDDHSCQRIDQDNEILGICGPGVTTQ